MLLEVVSLSGDVGGDLDRSGDAHARDLAQRGVRLLRCGRVHAGAHAAPLRCGDLLVALAGLQAGVAIFFLGVTRPLRTSCEVVGIERMLAALGGHGDTGRPLAARRASRRPATRRPRAPARASARRRPPRARTRTPVLKKLSSFDDYGKLRDFPAQDYSTHLSPYLKFTACSPREVCRHLDHDHELVRSLYWRDFFTGIAYFFPHVFKGCFHTQYDKLKWVNDKRAFKRWCEGTTGIPIVDAGMRQMNQTGFMHNRVRMIVGSFLVKDLHIDWRWGEKYFAQTLIDYDPAVNNGNWQWVASTGCDAQPYFRIFNPWSQQKKFDPDCDYIKKWVPELRDLSPKAIHEQYPTSDYPLPIAIHQTAAKEALRLYKLVH